MQVPYDDVAMRETNTCYRILNRKFRQLNFVIGNKKYFRVSEVREQGLRCPVFLHTSMTVVYKISYRRARAWPSGCIGRVRRASKGFLHTTMIVNTYAKNNFKPRVMLWIAMLLKLLLTPVPTSGRSMVVNI